MAIKLEQAEQLENFLELVEATIIDLAEKEGVMIRVERDTRGRFPTFALRACHVAEGGERVVLMRKLNGHKLK